jgi:hypothetical protein
MEAAGRLAYFAYASDTLEARRVRQWRLVCPAALIDVEIIDAGGLHIDQ